ncbi:hypothetical protein QBC36DRAFT_318832 [Triangularia setosa]|uniref:Secreted protein n=1 Tax=Triangularia setosa TaxID=2587417 RepID=A0AAN7AC33_9PEZI|nr:hypothetical protein QBC36DRAFT_318832 [Podospora setosa]
MMLWLFGELLAMLAKSVCPALVTPELYITKSTCWQPLASRCASSPIRSPVSDCQCCYSDLSAPHVAQCGCERCVEDRRKKAGLKIRKDRRL